MAVISSKFYDPNHYARHEQAAIRAEQQTKPLTYERAVEIAKDISYKRNGRTWRLTVGRTYYAAAGIDICWETTVLCVLTGMEQQFRGGYERVPDGATEADFLRLALGGLMAAEMHEVREHFLYKGARIFDPHESLPPAERHITVKADGLTLEIPNGQ